MHKSNKQWFFVHFVDTDKRWVRITPANKGSCWEYGTLRGAAALVASGQVDDPNPDVKIHERSKTLIFCRVLALRLQKIMALSFFRNVVR